MSVTITQLPNSEVEVSGEVSTENLEAAWKKAVEEAVKETEIPGFRKGQAPQEAVVAKVGSERLLYRAAERALGEAWVETLKTHHIQAIGLPDMSVLKLARGNPLVWRAKVALLPSVTLPAYREIAKQSKDLFQKNDNQKEEQARDKARMELLDKISKESAMEIPSVLQEGEKFKMLAELRGGIEGMGLRWEDYLGHVKKSEEEILAGFAQEAEKRARYGLVLRAIAEQEHIEPSSEEVQDRLHAILPAYSPEEQKKLDKDRLKVHAYGAIRNEKVFLLLEAIATT